MHISNSGLNVETKFSIDYKVIFIAKRNALRNRLLFYTHPCPSILHKTGYGTSQSPTLQPFTFLSSRTGALNGPKSYSFAPDIPFSGFGL
jgi:hypothetical protein